MSATAASQAVDSHEFVPRPPSYLDSLLSNSRIREVAFGGFRIQIESCEPFQFMRVRVPGAGVLDAETYHDAVYGCYQALGGLIRQENLHPVRFWNYLPGILREHPDGRSGYEIFNAGRFNALQDLYGRMAPEKLAVASAVGGAGEDLNVHVLASSQAAQPVANPRQLAPHEYSKRYGPLPPVFARACVLASTGRALLGRSALVAGTASIVGEHTLHRGQLDRQLDEVSLNLASLSNALAGTQVLSMPEALARYRDLRVYVPNQLDKSEVLTWLQNTFSEVSHAEFVHADLCRSDLHVEVEGTLNFAV
ncbi:MAG: hypothetical protein OSB70_05095 [Myxococcota bacterium]|nr:hypothetical protein [Myxococcota bacterium]